MQENVRDQIEQHQQAQFQHNMDLVTLAGNLTNWRENFSDNSRRVKVLNGHQKIMQFLARGVQPVENKSE